MSAAELPGPGPERNPQVLEPYIAAMEDSTRPTLRTAWRDNNTFEIEGAVDAGRMVAVSMNADPGWHAAQEGRAIPVETDNLGFMVLRPSTSAATRIELRYRVGVEPRIMAAVSALAWIGAVGALFVWRKHSDSAATN